VSQADNAGTVTSGEAAGQALAAEGGEAGSGPAVAAGPLAGEGLAGEGRTAGDSAADDLDEDDLGDEDAGQDDLDEDDLGDEDADDLAEASGEAAAEDNGAVAPELTMADLEQESEIAADYVEGLLDVADLDGDIDMDVEGDRALVSVVGATLQELIGPRGEVLEALQELTRLAVHRQTGARTRIMLDVGGYRANRRVELTELGRDAADEVKSSGVPRRLDAMTPFERKIVHDAVAAAGLRSESEGEEPNRRVVVFPAG
jgi:spoIIIJ-associated protein